MSDPTQRNHEPNDEKAPYPKGKKWVGGKFVMMKINPNAPPEELDAQIDAFCEALGFPKDNDERDDENEGASDRNDGDEPTNEKGEDSSKGGT